MTLRNILLAGTALGAATLLAGPALAASNTQAELDALKAQIESLQRKIDDVEIQQGNRIKTLEERKSDVEVSLKDGRPVFKTADGNFTFGITGRAHLDVGGYHQSDSDLALAGGAGLQGNANFRRARLGFNGTFAKDFQYNIEFNFGDSGQESNARIYEVALHYKGIPGTTLSIGAFKPKMTLDDSTSSNDITFIERATVANLATSLGAGEARMGAGASYNNDNFFVSGYYTMGSATAGGTGTDYDRSNVVGRIAYATSPKEGLNVHVGASATHAFNLAGDSHTFSDRPELRVDRKTYLNTGAINGIDTATIYGPELALNFGPFRAQGEYYRFDLDGIAGGSAEFDAWYLQASWILTGESYKYDIKKAAYSGVKPANPFGFGGGGAGAWEIAARYSSADFNDASAAIGGSEQSIITVGLNWYVNNNMRFMLNYLDVDVSDSGGVPGVDFGHQAVALRTQFAF